MKKIFKLKKHLLNEIVRYVGFIENSDFEVYVLDSVFIKQPILFY